MIQPKIVLPLKVRSHRSNLPWNTRPGLKQSIGVSPYERGRHISQDTKEASSVGLEHEQRFPLSTRCTVLHPQSHTVYTRHHAVAINYLALGVHHTRLDSSVSSERPSDDRPGTRQDRKESFQLEKTYETKDSCLCSGQVEGGTHGRRRRSFANFCPEKTQRPQCMGSRRSMTRSPLAR